MNTRYLITCVGLACVTALGCGDGGNYVEEPGPMETPPPMVMHPRLEILGPSAINVEMGHEGGIAVRYVTASGAFIPNAPVTFSTLGDLMGSSLSALTVNTDAEGIARVTVRAGTVETSFAVDATAADVTRDASWGVTVVPPANRSLELVATYRGARTLVNSEFAVFGGTTCRALETTVPRPIATAVARVGSRATTREFRVGTQLAIYALGIDTNDTVAATGCTDVRLQASSGRVEVPLADVPFIRSGTYAVQERLDITASLPPALDTILHVMHGLSTDPATFIVDYVASIPGAPALIAAAIGPMGILRPAVITFLRDILGMIHPPEFVTRLLTLGADLDRALTNVTLLGTFEVGEPNEFGIAHGRHTITTVRMPLASGMTDRAVTGAAAAVDFTVGTTITAPEHPMGVSIGAVVDGLLSDVLLPTLPGAPHSMRAFLASYLDCADFASHVVGGTDPAVVSTATSVCELGRNALADTLQAQLTNLFHYDALNLAESATLVDSDHDYDTDRLDMGVTNARWTGSSGELRTMGTLTGVRTPDDRRTHPMRRLIAEGPGVE